MGSTGMKPRVLLYMGNSLTLWATINVSSHKVSVKPQKPHLWQMVYGPGFANGLSGTCRRSPAYKLSLDTTKTLIAKQTSDLTPKCVRSLWHIQTVFVAWIALHHFGLFHEHCISIVLQPTKACQFTKLLPASGNFPFSGFRGTIRGKLLVKIKLFTCL